MALQERAWREEFQDQETFANLRESRDSWIRRVGYRNKRVEGE
jgi:hypothetical protein